MSQIKCSVDSCKFNSNSFCNANEIKVCNCGCSCADCSSETACSTFARK